MRITIPACGLVALLLAAAGPRTAVAGILLVANKSDDTVDLFDTESSTPYLRLPTGGAPHEVEISPDGTLAVVSNYGDRERPGSSLTVIDLGRSEVARTVDLGEHTRPHGLAWAGPSRVAVTTEGSAHLLLVDARSGDILQAVATGQEVSHMVAVTPDQGRAFVANIGSGSVTAIDLRQGVKLADIRTGDGAEGIAVGDGGREIWVGNRAADTLSVIDAESLKIIATLPCPGFPIRVALTPDGERVLVSAASSGEVVVFDARRRQEVLRRRLDLSKAPDASLRLFGDQFGESPVPVGLVVAPGGQRAWIAATQADAVVEVEVETLAVRGLLRAGREPDGMAFSPLDPPRRPQ